MSGVTIGMTGDPLRRVIERAEERGFARKIVTMPPGATRDYDAAEWHDALVVVSAGELTVIARCGARIRFCTGDVLCLSGVALRTLRNDGPDPLELVAITRAEDGF